jgi:hypothetical protein
MGMGRSDAGSRRAAQRGLTKVWLGLVLAAGWAPVLPAGAPPQAALPEPEGTPRLVFRDLLQVQGTEARISPRARALAGRRVTLVGFMARMEVPPTGGFYLTPRPVACDEEGGGTADLPPETVFVVVRSAAGRELPWSPRALEVSGLLEVGYHLEEDRQVSHFRILLDRPQDLPALPSQP